MSVVEYFDKHGNQIHAGDKVKMDSGEVKTVYLTEEEDLGFDATNPRWVEKGWATPCEFGIYPLSDYDEDEMEIEK